MFAMMTPSLLQAQTAICPPELRRAATQYDYRERDASEMMRWNYQDNWKQHTGPALERMSKGEFSRQVMADLDFTLRYWPNHANALLALLRYDLSGGRPHEFLPAPCYFVRARLFAPMDPSVELIEGTYLYKKGQLAESQQAFQRALDLDPLSAEAHYNLGLTMFTLKNFSGARQHAIEAYRLGYPLPGLKDKLKAAGEWHGQ